jgi:hypothetical protein
VLPRMLELCTATLTGDHRAMTGSLMTQRPMSVYLVKIMSRYRLADKWCYRFPIKSRWYGLSHKKCRMVVESADLLINVSGTLKRPQDYRQVQRLVYIDSDPVFTQVKLKLCQGQIKFRKRLNAHDIYFSFSERFSEAVPATRHYWRPTRQPPPTQERRVELLVSHSAGTGGAW